MEGIFDLPDFAGRAHDDFYDVESVSDIWHVEHAEPFHCAANNEAAFFFVNRIRRATEFLDRARLDFHEYQFPMAFVAADDIDFATMRSAEIAIEDLVAMTLQIGSGKVFAQITEGDMRRFTRVWPAQPAQNFGDGSDKGHGPEVWQSVRELGSLYASQNHTRDRGGRFPA